MRNRISVADYNADWAFKERFQEPRARAGYLTPEEIVRFYGTLGVDGLDLTHFCWEKCSPAYVKTLAADSGLRIICYIFLVDLVLPSRDRKAALGTAFSLLDRTAELGASLAMIIPGWVKENVPLQEQRSWLVEGLRECANHAKSLGVMLAIENLDDDWGRPLMGRGSQCREICTQVDSPPITANGIANTAEKSRYITPETFAVCRIPNDFICCMASSLAGIVFKRYSVPDHRVVKCSSFIDLWVSLMPTSNSI